jgi:hypothetical protein
MPLTDKNQSITSEKIKYANELVVAKDTTPNF